MNAPLPITAETIRDLLTPGRIRVHAHVAPLPALVAAIHGFDRADLLDLLPLFPEAHEAAIDPSTAAWLDAVNTLLFAVTDALIAGAGGDGGPVTVAMTTLLALPPGHIANQGTFRAALWNALRWYYTDRTRPALVLLRPVRAALRRWGEAERVDLDVLTDLGDFHFHVVWNFSPSSTSQARLGLEGMGTLAQAMARGAGPRPATAPRGGRPVHVAYLAMFADPADPMTVALRHVAPALTALTGRFRLTVYAWSNVDPAFLDWLRGLGATCHAVSANRPTEVVEAIESLAQGDPPDIVISDMNNGIPTALFARRLAPAQLFLQGGMPAWPVRPLHGVFNSFGFDPLLAGWGGARQLPFHPPWDLAKLNPPGNPDVLARERARLPQGMRLIGNYGRLVKVTEPCLMAAEAILRRVPDVAFVTGGTGDPRPIEAFIAQSPVGDRMAVIPGFVPGHEWGRLLHLFLDTWPITGGESSREMIAKGRPVIARRSAEMPAIDAQRDPLLIADSWDEYVAKAERLLRDGEAYAGACARAEAMARSFGADSDFPQRLAESLESVLADALAATRT